MITVHHLELSRSFRILWALEELGQDYQIQYYKRLPTFGAPDTLKKIHPLGKAPILTDDTGAYAESGAILEYLQMAYDQNQVFKPKNKKDLQQYIFWMHYAEGSFMPMFMFSYILHVSAKKAPLLMRPVAKVVTKSIQDRAITPRIQDHIGYVEQYLSTHEYFAGEFSFADIQMSFPLKAFSARTQLEIPQIRKYLARIEQRGAYKKAKEKEISIQ